MKFREHLASGVGVLGLAADAGIALTSMVVAVRSRSLSAWLERIGRRVRGRVRPAVFFGAACGAGTGVVSGSSAVVVKAGVAVGASALELISLVAGLLCHDVKGLSWSRTSAVPPTAATIGHCTTPVAAPKTRSTGQLPVPTARRCRSPFGVIGFSLCVAQHGCQGPSNRTNPKDPSA